MDYLTFRDLSLWFKYFDRVPRSHFLFFTCEFMQGSVWYILFKLSGSDSFHRVRWNGSLVISLVSLWGKKYILFNPLQVWGTFKCTWYSPNSKIFNVSCSCGQAPIFWMEDNDQFKLEETPLKDLVFQNLHCC